MTNKSLYSWGGLALLAVLFLTLTIISSSLFQGARLDLTENNLYTLSQGAKNILADIEEPIQVRLFFSQQTSEDLPQIRAYYQRVRELLEEFKQRAGGNLQLNYIDPAPFSEQEDQAAAFGLQAVPINNSGDNLYFGIVASNSLDGTEVIPFVQPDKEEFLEYDLAKILYTLNQPDKLRVGLISGLPISGGFDPQRQAPTPAWAVYQQLQDIFEIENISPQAAELPDGLAMLMLVHPSGLSDDLRYAIDQFALAGGNVLAFVDPRSETDNGDREQQVPGMPPGGGKSNLPELFKAWGVEFDDANIVGDARYALQVSVGAGQPPIRHIGILGLNAEAMSDDDIVTAQLDTVNLSTAGHFTPAENAATQLEPLLFSSENSQLIDANRLLVLSNPAELLNGFQASGTIYNMGVRVAGTVSSAFAERAASESGIAEGDINVILLGDTDMLGDRYWVQTQNFFGQTILSAFANNGDLVVNSVDNLIGNSDLISIRTRAVASRPFTRVDELRLQAEQRLRDTEQQLQQRLQETEQRINELQASRSTESGQDNNLTVFSQEQEAEVQQFLDQKLEIRKQLRQVRRELDKDIEALGTSLKIINIVVVPILIIALALILAVRRRRA